MALLAAAAAAGGVYAAYAQQLRAQVAADMHRILGDYIPLAGAPPLSDPNDVGDADSAGSGTPLASLGGAAPGAGGDRLRSAPGAGRADA
ncbi:MAG: hypothetical protein J3K34DRAFT_422524 [Monoraphidium minutum]|nr:MAG: hypothetical protein J3K34DRAFT_422524 [Monoraphidium minutum]